MLPKVRVFYRPDGGVSIMSFLAGACGVETETQCMNRMTAESSYNNLPYDDLDPSQLPKDRKDRDEWRGSKGAGIWIDESLVTKNEKMEELKQELGAELNKTAPNPIRVVKLQYNIDQLKELQPANNLLSAEQINQFAITPSLGGFQSIDVKKQSFVSKIWQRIKNLFDNIIK